MSDIFVVNNPTCMRSGLPVTNCSCSGHSTDYTPTPIPITELDYDALSVANVPKDNAEPDAEEAEAAAEYVTNGGGLPEFPIDWAAMAARD